MSLGGVQEWINKFKIKFTEDGNGDMIDSLIYKNTHKKRVQAGCVILEHFLCRGVSQENMLLQRGNKKLRKFLNKKMTLSAS